MRWGLAVLVLVFAMGSVAEAQLPEPPAHATEEDIAAARESFIRGMGHARASRWEDAVTEFLASYRQSGSPVALLNAGTSFSELGRHRDATEALLRVLHDPGFDEATREALERALEASSAHVGILTLHGIPAEGVRWSLDGAPRGPVRRQPLVVVTTPGAHEVVLDAPEQAPWRWDGELAAGARLERNVTFAPEVATDPAEPSSEDPLPFVLLGAGAAAIVAAIIAAVLIDDALQLEARSPFVIELP